MVAPIFTIILPTYNSAAKAAATIDSVLAQAFPDFELLIVDGASTDDTSKSMADYTRDVRIRFNSEADDGIYDAMNRGIRLARGRFLYFIGAGDLLRPGVLAKVAARLSTPGRTLMYGSVWLLDQRLFYDGPFTRRKLRRKNICHQAIFYERTIFDMLGGYDAQYPYLADWAFNMKCFGDGRVRKQYIEEVIADYEGNGLSMTQPDWALANDYAALIRRHLGPVEYFLHHAEPRVAELKEKILRRAAGALGAYR